MSQDRPNSGSPAPGEFIIEADAPAVSRKIRRKKTPFWRSPLMIIFLVLIGAGGGLFYIWQQQQAIQGMMLAEIEDQTIEELSELTFKLPFSNDSVDPELLQISLERGPEGAVIDPKTATFRWTPSEEVGPTELEVGIEVRPRTNPENVSRQQFKIVVTEKLTAPEIDYIDLQTVRAGLLTRVPINVNDPDIPQQEYLFELVGETPEGAKIDADFGTFSWKPSEELVNRTFDFEVKVSEVDHPELSATRKFQIKVQSYDPIKKLNDLLADSGLNLEYLGREPDGPFQGAGQVMRLGQSRLDVYSYPSKEAADKDAEMIAADLSTLFDIKDPFTVPTKIYRDDRLIVVAAGVQDGLHFRLSFVLGTAIASTNNFDSETVASNMTPTTPTDGAEKMTQTEEDQKDPLGDQLLEKHYSEKTLFNKRNYPRFGRFMQTDLKFTSKIRSNRHSVSIWRRSTNGSPNTLRLKKNFIRPLTRPTTTRSKRCESFTNCGRTTPIELPSMAHWQLRRPLFGIFRSEESTITADINNVRIPICRKSCWNPQSRISIISSRTKNSCKAAHNSCLGSFWFI